MASIYKKKRDKAKRGSCWYVDYTDETGTRRTRKGFTDKGLTEQLGAKLENEVMLKKRGLIDPAVEKMAAKKKLPIDDHVEAYKKELTSKKNTPKHVSLTLGRVRKVIEGCEFETLADIKEDEVQEFLYELQIEDDLGNRTYNHYVQAFDGFCNWLVSKHRLAFNPVPGLVRLNNEVDIRHRRRALSEDEVGKLIQSARTSGVEIQCFDGEQRARIYIISYMTGLRRKEIASLTPQSFDLDAISPTLTVQAPSSKHRKLDVLPLHLEFVSMVREWHAELPADQILFPKLAKRRTWLMVKKDLERIGIPYETPEGIADFHAAGRHSHITGLIRNGASLPEAQKLARHSDIKMTMKYTHIGMADQAKAVQRLSCQRFGSVSAVAGSLPVSPDGTDGEGKPTPRKRQNPGGDRGYDSNCPSVSSVGKTGKKWRRRELNPHLIWTELLVLLAIA